MTLPLAALPACRRGASVRPAGGIYRRLPDSRNVKPRTFPATAASGRLRTLTPSQEQAIRDAWDEIRRLRPKGSPRATRALLRQVGLMRE